MTETAETVRQLSGTTLPANPGSRPGASVYEFGRYLSRPGDAAQWHLPTLKRKPGTIRAAAWKWAQSEGATIATRVEYPWFRVFRLDLEGAGRV